MEGGENVALCEVKVRAIQEHQIVLSSDQLSEAVVGVAVHPIRHPQASVPYVAHPLLVKHFDFEIGDDAARKMVLVVVEESSS